MWPSGHRPPALRAGASELSQALTKAELVPGEIEIRDGSRRNRLPARAAIS